MTTLNPSDKSANATLFNSNLSVSGQDAAHALVRSTTSKSSGKAFVQVYLNNTTGALAVVGIADATADLSQYVSIDTHSAGWAHSTGGWYWNGSGSLDFSNSSAGHYIGLGIDFDTPGSGQGTIQINVDGGSYTSHVENIPPGPWFICLDVGALADNLTINFGGSSFVGSPPAGYPAWDGAAQISGSLNSTLGAATSAATAQAIISGVLTH